MALSTRCKERFLARPEMTVDAFPQFPMEFAGLSEIRPVYRVRRWQPDHHLLLFTLEGSARLQLGAATFRLQAGSVCVLPAGIDHEYSTGGQWKLVWFHPARTPAWDALIGREPAVRPFLFGTQVATLAESLWAEFNSNDPAAREAIRLTGPLLLHYLQRELERPEDVRQRRWRLKLEPVWDAVLAAPAEWDVAAIAAKVGWSRTQLHAVCRALYRTSARERLQQFRFRRAAEYLRHSEWTLEQIAVAAGYSDAFAFSKAFSRQMQCPPSVYRAQFRAGRIMDAS